MPENLLTVEVFYMQEKKLISWKVEAKLDIPKKLDSALLLVWCCQWLSSLWLSPKTLLQSCTHRTLLSIGLWVHTQGHSSHRFPSPWWIHETYPQLDQALQGRNQKALDWSSHPTICLMLWNRDISLVARLSHASIQALLLHLQQFSFWYPNPKAFCLELNLVRRFLWITKKCQFRICRKK